MFFKVFIVLCQQCITDRLALSPYGQASDTYDASLVPFTVSG
jgi:hypothetical protein